MSPVLTPLMARVLARYASGVGLKEIGEEIYYGHWKMDDLSLQIRERLGAKNLAQAALIAHKLGYISLPDESGIVYAQSPFTTED